MRKRKTLLLAALLLLIVMTGCGQAEPEQTENQTVAATAVPETTEMPQIAIIDQQSLLSALATAPYVDMTGSVELTVSAVLRGGELNGFGNTLTAPTYVEGQRDTYVGLVVQSGTVRDLTILGGYRGVGNLKEYPILGDIRLYNLTIEAQSNAMNFGFCKTSYTLSAENCIFHGWSSFNGFQNAYFEGCTFGKGQSDTRGNLRPYVDTSLVGCHFESHTTADGEVVPYSLILNEKTSNITITLTDCYADGTLITEENVESLLQIKLYDNILRVCNTVS